MAVDFDDSGGFRAWVKAGVFERLFDAVSDDPDMEYAMVDVA